MRLVIDLNDDPRTVELESFADSATLRELVEGVYGAPLSAGPVWVDDVPHDPQDPLARASLMEGSTLRPDGGEALEALSGWTLTVLGEEDVGPVVRVPDTGVLTIGRSPEADVPLPSRSASWLHATVERDEEGLLVKDRGSTNGTLLDGDAVDEEGARIDADAVLRIGDCAIAARKDVEEPRAPRPGSLHNITAAGTVPFNRPPRPGRRKDPEPLTPPERPRQAQPTRFSLIAVVGPLILAVVMVVMMRDLRYAMFSAMSPLLAIGNWFDQKRRRRAEKKEAEKTFSEDLERFTASLREAAAAELAARRAAVPAVDLAARRALWPTTTLWQRRHDDPDVLLLSAGVADSPWRPAVDARAARKPVDEVRAALDASVIAAGPAEVDLSDAGVVGIVGRREATTAVARSLLLQAAVHCGPADLTIGVFHDPGRDQEWEWTRWLPHTRRLGTGDEGRWISGRRRESDSLLSGLRDGVEALATPNALLLIDSDVLTEGRESPARSLLGRGRGAVARSGQRAPRRVSGIVLAATREQLPASCTVVIEAGRDGAAVLERPGDLVRVEDVALSGIGADGAARAAMAMARLEDPELEVPGASLPGLVRLGPLLGMAAPTAQEVLDSWRAPGAQAPVGVGERGMFSIDLVRDGPHGLVGGTTGSGKSEFLRTLVAGLAARNDPTSLTFILIDFKGGAAFKTCERLPHTIGTISNLDAQMADRALRALEAEMTYRQRVFAGAGEGVDNLDAYLATNPTEPMPRLLLVVDEFAMLAKEYPDVLSSLVSVGAVGRTLGVHMILATQRPAGVVNDDILANTNMRVALRVQSREDSSNVIDVPDAAAIGRQQKGRALVKLGQDDITPVQTALVTGPIESEEREAIAFTDLTTGGSSAPSRPAPPARRPAPGEPETDLDALIDAIVEANAIAGFAPPRPVWPEPLGARVNLAGFPRPTRTDAPGGEEDAAGADPDDTASKLPAVGGLNGDTLVFALSDDPDGQRQLDAGWDMAEGNLILGGVPGSGTTTALVAIALTAARALDPQELDIVVLDMSAGDLEVLTGLPHLVGYAGAGSGARERQSRLLKFLRAEVQRRRGAPDRSRRMLVLVDGFAALRDEYQDVDGLPLLESFYRSYADGPEVGVHFAMTTTRVKAIPSAIDEVTTQKWLFRLADRYDYSSAGIKPEQMPADVNGRAVPVLTRLQTHIATPGCGARAAVEHIASRVWPHAPAKPSVVGELPTLVRVGELDAVARLAHEPWRLPVGIGEADLKPALLESYEGEHILVAGPPRSGKSTTLLTLAAAARTAADGPEPPTIAAIASRRSPLAAADLDQVVTDPADAAGLLAALRLRQGPVLVLVDDAERIDDSDHALAELLAESPPNVRIAAAGRADDLRTLYSHWTKTLRRSRCGILLQPNVDMDGDLLSARIPRRAPVVMTVGRGYLCLNGGAALIQTALPQ